ncbi:MAG: DNA polymerase IV [Candidatus Thiodiazotropha sp. (ex Epidulcina cf. delphinae)]|nr:DNA polymerase IV [Candidatus Thiodiazotropha sp. (ex Epidulcina cf. delphinae)]
MHYDDNRPDTHWSRAVILVDMNAFFCSVEQMDHPELQGRPIGITNGAQGTCIITCSYEARAYGVRTGMRLKEARRICPGFLQVPARPERYARISSRIMEALSHISPDMEIFSVDEAFLDIARCQRLLGAPRYIARRVKQTVLDASGGVLCSVGVSGDKTTAKYAAKLQKPNGLTIIPPGRAQQTLARIPVTELCGIASGIGRYLAERGVHTCADMRRLPIGEIGRRFGNPGRRIWLMTQGLDPDPVQHGAGAPKSIGHGKVMPPNTRERAVIETFLLHMAEKVAARLRLHHFRASLFYVGVRIDEGWLSHKYRCNPATDHAPDILAMCDDFLDNHWSGQGCHQVQITALDPKYADYQVDFLEPDHQRRDRLNQAMDSINRRYGEFTLAPTRLLSRSRMPNVIAPAWRPTGHRETILNE